MIFLSCSKQSTPEREVPIVAAVVPGMVLIPGGEFMMGKDTEDGEHPEHKVYVDSFYMDQYEVTNLEWLEYCEDTGKDLPIFWGVDKFRCGLDYPYHPVVGVSWAQSEAYAEWCGKRLPTEAEWEYAARGGLEGQHFPNGDDVTLDEVNYRGSEGTDPVGSYEPNGYGLCDMAGNVGEWVSDWWSEDYYINSPAENPQGPEEGMFKVVRGGGWFAGKYCNRVYARTAIPVNWVDFNAGFRCVKDIR
jgi:formylglycine-generating enzyme required for sulfatase activity